MSNISNQVIDKIIIVGQGRDDLGHRYFKLKIMGARANLQPYSASDLLKPRERLFPELIDAGCNLLSNASQHALLKKLEDSNSDAPASFLAVPRLGSFGTYYVRPHSIVGKPPLPVERSFGSLAPNMLSKYRWQGSLSRWQEQIGHLCDGNSRLIFAAGLACTGPILPFVKGPRTGGFQITGPAETGKTAAGMVAGSVWGCHRDPVRAEKGFAESWNTTINQLDETAQAHCDAILVLDETNLAGIDPKSLALAILNGLFRLSEGSKKKRYNEPETPAWRLYFLSTSNLTLDELAAAGGVPIDDQHRGRLVDIGLPNGGNAFGIYENLHGYEDGAALTDAIKDACRHTFGAPGYEFVRRIYKNKRALMFAKAFVAKRRDGYIRLARRRAAKTGVKLLERATARFATVYAAGCLAIYYRIFTWSRADQLQAVSACQFDRIGSDDPIAPTSSARRLSDYLNRNREAFFDLDQSKLDPDRDEFGSAPQYRQTFKGTTWLYLTAEQLKSIIGTGIAAKKFKAELAKRRVLATAGDRFLVQRPIFVGKGNKGHQWVHAFRADALLENLIVGP